MKILVFEYITGGGFNKQDLPDSLAREGLLMLRALLADFARLPTVEPLVMLDVRFAKQIDTENLGAVWVDERDDSQTVFLQLAQQCDAVWPIAPEFDGILASLCGTVEQLGKLLLNSSAAGVALTANKLSTYQRLLDHAIPTVATRLFDSQVSYPAGEYVVKPIDGVGCQDSYVIHCPQDFQRLDHLGEGYIIQPHLLGEKTSLSAIFKQGCADWLCGNRQVFQVTDHQYHLIHIDVNVVANAEPYQNLLNKIAQAFPELFGYVGIDLIESGDDCRVLEINPRLTTSYVGIYPATGINVAGQVIHALTAIPNINAIRNQTITIQLNP
ncbi:ATP-grasp domain-containing protein [Methylosoma difficile]